MEQIQKYPPKPGHEEQPQGLALKEAKTALRKALIASRKAIPVAEREAASRAMLQRLQAEGSYQRAHTLLVYAPFDAEIRVDFLFDTAEAAGKILLFPVCLRQGEMEAYLPRDRQQMRRDRYGIPAPDPEKDELYAPEKVDLVIVPLLSFDRQGYRMGYGGGYYDRYLKRIDDPGKMIGLSFASQERENLPHGYYDVPLPLILTESERVVTALR